MAPSNLVFRPYPGISIGCDPGRDGAIVLTDNGEVLDIYNFAPHIIHTGHNSNLMLIDPQWLDDVLTLLRLRCDRFVIESPVVTTYGGKMKVQDIVKLHNTYAQIAAAAMMMDFEVIHADPQDWQGSQSAAKTTSKTVKEVIADYWTEQGLSLSSGAADAAMIAQHVPRDVEVVPRAKRGRGTDKKVFG